MSKIKTEMRLPRICAWCGNDQGVSSYPIKIHGGHVHMSFSLPACKSCEARLKKEARLREEYQALLRQSGLIGVGVGFLVGMIIGVVLFSGLDYLSIGGLLLGGVAIGIVGGIIGVYIGRAVGAGRHRDHPGAAVKDLRKSYEMAWGSVTRFFEFNFKNEYFADRFAALNPNLIQDD